MAQTAPQPAAPAAIVPGAEAGVLQCTGAWTLAGITVLERRLNRMRWPGAHELIVDAGDVAAMDTAGAWLLQRTVQGLRARGHEVALRGLQADHQALMDMISRRDVYAGAAPARRVLWLERLGRRSSQVVADFAAFLAFVGDGTLNLLFDLLRPLRLRWAVLFENVYTAGYKALPIAGLLAFLMGIVIAYQGAVQLSYYGADIYVADLVGISMLRELGPLITAIVVAGRTGSAYTAQIGTMKVTEEIDAMRTLGILPMEMLVVPKLLALMIALPLLTVFADIAGVVGGMLMARIQLELSFVVYLDRLQEAVTLTYFMIGLGKAPVFATLITMVGCYQGFQVSGGTEGVGSRTTRSVVQSIFLVIVADALFSILFSWLGV